MAEAEAEIFLNPNYERDFHDSFLMKDMDKVCTRLFEAIERGEKMVIYADYDCDGIPGAVILNDLLKKPDIKILKLYTTEKLRRIWTKSGRDKTIPQKQSEVDNNC